MNSESVWREYAWNLIADRLADVISLVEEVAFRRMDERLADYLEQSTHTNTQAMLKITHQQIASELGTSREVISRLLKDMQQQGKLELGRGWIRLS